MSDNDMKALEDLARIKAISGPGSYKWSSWESPIGLVLFLIGLCACGILIRFAVLMK